jgi:hypothetical protein
VPDAHIPSYTQVIFRQSHRSDPHLIILLGTQFSIVNSERRSFALSDGTSECLEMCTSADLELPVRCLASYSQFTFVRLCGEGINDLLCDHDDVSNII